MKCFCLKALSLFFLYFTFSNQLVFALSDAAEIQSKLSAIRSMSATFTQVVRAGMREVSSSSGKMAFIRPGRFRWQTQSPLEQLIVADSENLWIYDVDLDQVTVKKQDKSIVGTPALFLSNYNETVNKDFSVSKKISGPNEVFELKALSDKENYQRLTLTFSYNSLSKIEFFDQLGQHTIVSLSNIKTNSKIESQLFKFNPPKGVDVIKQ